MSARVWTEIKTINDKTYVLQNSSVLTHEDYVSHSYYFLREATEKDIEEHRFTEENRVER